MALVVTSIVPFSGDKVRPHGAGPTSSLPVKAGALCPFVDESVSPPYRHSNAGEHTIRNFCASLFDDEPRPSSNWPLEEVILV